MGDGVGLTQTSSACVSAIRCSRCLCGVLDVTHTAANDCGGQGESMLEHLRDAGYLNLGKPKLNPAGSV